MMSRMQFPWRWLGPAAALVSLACSQAASQSPAPSTSASPSTPASARYTPADVEFLTGMIPHHTQAIRIANWAPTHDAGAALRVMAQRIIVAQRDEIGLMQRWLREHGQPVPESDTTHAHHMAGMDHGAMMPGMLSQAQLDALDQARGPEFDRLFLLYMIQHHQGALTMVEKLVNSPGAAQDDFIFKLVSDMNADQLTEIERMKSMLVDMTFEEPGQ